MNERDASASLLCVCSPGVDGEDDNSAESASTKPNRKGIVTGTCFYWLLLVCEQESVPMIPMV
jgi:hypothetical protein